MVLDGWNLPPVREGHEAPAGLVARRVAAAAFSEEPEPGVTVERELVGGVPCTIVEGPTPVLTVVHLHGGGYRMGQADGWIGFASRLAAAGRARVVLPDYRLAPEDPYPAALHDAAAVYSALAAPEDDATPGPVLSGDSAGGGLAVAVAVAARGAAVRPPAGLVLLSPWLDLTVSKPSFDANAATDSMISKASLTEAAGQYLQSQDPGDPLVSPLFADLAGIPPVLLFASCHEALLGDATAFAARAAAAGVAVEAHYVPDVTHVWPVLGGKDPEAVAALGATARFLTERHLAG